MIDRKEFFAAVKGKPFGGSLKQSQVNGMNAILDEWERRDLSDLRHLAYMLATTKWETDHTMQPIREKGGPAYFKKLYDVQGDNPTRARKMGNTEPGDGARYNGKGFVQLTWKKNYQRMGKLLGRDLANNPDLALQPQVATEILFEGMLEGASSVGDFTGKSLEDYFNDSKDDPNGARRIINGTDHAADIAKIHRDFLAALEASSTSIAPAADPEYRPEAPAVVDPEYDQAEVPLPRVKPPIARPEAKNDGRAEMVQKRLKALGYHEIGEPDGDIAGRTKAGIAAFQFDRGIQGEPTIDDALLREIDNAEAEKWRRPIAVERENATPAMVAKKTEVVGASQQNKIMAWIVGLPATALAFAQGIMSKFSDLWDSDFVMGVRDFASENIHLIAFGVAGVAIWQWWQSRRAEKAAVNAYREGRLS